MPFYTEEELEDMFGEGECSCRLRGRGGNDPDSYWRIDKWCPIHGIDPDRAYDEWRDRPPEPRPRDE